MQRGSEKSVYILSSSSFIWIYKKKRKNEENKQIHIWIMYILFIIYYAELSLP